jgi:hypothetical protein
MTFAGIYRLRFGKLPIIYKALIIPQSKFNEIENNIFVMNFHRITDLLPLSNIF